MADALQNAPSKKSTEEVEVLIGETKEVVKKDSNEHIYLSKTYDVEKKYMFQLAQEIPEPEYPVVIVTGSKARVATHKRFSVYRNLTYTSQITWKGQRRGIRYYDGCDTIFIDKQPKDKDSIDQFIRQTRRRFFNEGKLGVYGDEKMLLLYMMMCSWNGDSPFKTRTANAIFISTDTDKIISAESNRLDKAEKALELAKKSSASKMKIHADYLGIATIDYDSGNDLTEKELRIEYRKRALEDPDGFIASYDNKSMEVKYLIDKALERGVINNKHNSNSATWGTNNTVICDISGLISMESIAQKIFEFSQTEEGAEFVIQLRAVIED